MAAANTFFGLYQDWVHNNHGTHLDGRVDEDGKWQAIWGKLVFFAHPMLKFCLDTHCGALQHMRSEVES